MVWLEKKPGPAAGGLVAGDPSARSAASEAIRFQRKLGLAPVPPGTLSLLSHQWSTGHMTAHRANDSTNAATEAFDSRAYLLTRYGLRMNKREVCFEAKKSRATIDNMRNPRHRSFDRRLVAAQVDLEGDVENGVPILFKTPAIADWLAGN